MWCKTRKLLFWAVLPAVIMMLTFAQTGSATSIPASSRARTQKDFKKAMQAWRYRTIVGGYAKVGNHKAKWDALAKRFLKGYYLQGAKDEAAPFSASMVSDGKSLIKQGCNDAVVLSCCGVILCRGGNMTEGTQVLKRSLDAYARSGYHKARECIAVESYIQAQQGAGTLSQSNYQQLVSRAVACMEQSMSDGSFRKGEQRVMLNVLYTSNPAIFGQARTRVRSLLSKAHNMDPYFLKTVCGLIEVDEAWAARGDAMGYAVTDAGWKGFFAHLQSADKLLTAAWKLHPEYPEAPTAMIPVTMGLETGGPKELRKWFNRAVTAEFDHMQAYSQLQWALRPRWCGSVPMLYDFAVDCLNTRRFDTEVPLFFFNTLCTIETESAGNQHYWKTADTQKRLRMMFDGYARAGYGKGPNWFRTMEAALDVHLGKTTEAKTILKKLGPKVDQGTFVSFCGASPSQVLGSPSKAKKPTAGLKRI